MNKKQVWLGRIARVLIPLLFSVAAILWVRSRLDFSQVWDVLKLIHWQGLVIHGLVFLAGLVLRALSFSVILGDDFSNVTSFHGMNAGYLLNNILPFRLGEFGRAGLLVSHATHQVNFLEVFAGIVTERTLDLLIGVLFFLAGLLMMEGSLVPMWIVWLALILLIAFVVLASLGAKHQEKVIAFLNRKAEKRKLAREKLVPWLDSLLKGFHVFLQPRKLALAGFLLAVSWFCAMLEVYLLQLELMPGAQWWWPFLVLTAGVFVNAIPSAPGGIGVYEAGVVATYTALGADPAAGLAIALVMHVYQMIIPSILGVIGVYALGENLGQFLSRARFVRREALALEEGEISAEELHAAGLKAAGLDASELSAMGFESKERNSG